MTLTLDLPPDLEDGRRERLAVVLHDAWMVSQGRAAQIAGLGRAAFFDLLRCCGVTPFRYESAKEMLAGAQTARL